MSIKQTATSQPFVFIVCTPWLSHEGRPLPENNLLEIVEGANKFGFVPYTDPPDRLLIPADQLPLAEQMLRAENIRLLRSGVFAALHVSGGSISEYVRELVRAAYAAQIHLFTDLSPDSCLYRYIQWYERSVL